ncbi:hypothetical protein C1646_688207 [Rhizophagus diaphanus]|nr:hypothetical protein C1646_688207 [Rhizophagus diaphanus] [Rhizophagus sp. MUCL 43196]
MLTLVSNLINIDLIISRRCTNLIFLTLDLKICLFPASFPYFNCCCFFISVVIFNKCRIYKFFFFFGFLGLFMMCLETGYIVL